MIISEVPPGGPITIEHLPATSLCGFRLVPRVRAALLELGGEVSLLDLQKFLNGERVSEPLVSVARTNYEKESLREGYNRFIAAAEAGSREGRATSNKLAWIIGDSWLKTPSLELYSWTIDRIEELGFDEQLGAEYKEWLPWMSLGIINLFRRWRQPRIRTIRRALFKFSAGTKEPFPWDTGFPTWKRHLPMHTLYRHEPSRLLEEVLAAFSILDLSSINDLRCCHPEAVAASKSKERPLFVLYRELEKDSLLG